MKVVCFYHNADMDGICSAAIVRHKYPDVELIGVDYHNRLEEFEVDLWPSDTLVFVVDFTFPIGDMKHLYENFHLIWIDHHETSINKAEAENFKPAGLRAIGKAGCELTYEALNPTDTLPSVVSLLGRYDVWDHRYSKDCLPFQYGARQLLRLSEVSRWCTLLNSHSEDYCQTFSEVLDTGRIIFDYQRSEDARTVNSIGYFTRFLGFSALVVNRTHINSMFFDAHPRVKEAGVLMTYGWDEKAKMYKYSIYSDKPSINVAEIAQSCGGGGHANAAGFYHPEKLV